MPSDAVNVGLALTAAVGLGTIYVLLHEKKRKRKKLERALKDQPITKDQLLKILNKAAENSKVVVDKIRVEVRKVQVARNLSDEQTMQLFQQNFEHSLDQLIGAIRNQFNVTEKAMDASFKQHQNDPEVQQAIQNMRMLSATTPTPKAAAGAVAASPGGSSSSGQRAPAGAVELPASLTKDRLREIMTFNAVMLEKELRPIKEQVEKARQEGKQASVDSNLLMSVQMRISEAVAARFQVTDEQVMYAVEAFGAKNDPSFKDILQRIATTLSSSLG